jgi:hypothetical protein
MVAIAEIRQNGLTADGQQRFYGDADVDVAVHELEDVLSSLKAGGDLRPDFDPHIMAIAIRAAIDAVPRRLAQNPDFDVDSYATEIANVFDRATRAE